MELHTIGIDLGKNTQLAPSENRSQKSADGRVATVATRLGKNK